MTLLSGEGRTSDRVEAVLIDAMDPSTDQWDPVIVYVPQEFAKDIRELRFGYNSDLSYATCH